MTTGQLSLPRLRLPTRAQLPPGVLMLAAAAVGAAVLGIVAVTYPEWYRPLLAVAIGLNLIIVAMRWPRAAAVLTLLWLPFLTFVRRLLIPESGWSPNDPLILVGPVVALFLLYRLFVMERRVLAPDRLSKIVLALVVLAGIQAFNPLGVGGPVAGVGGLIFIGVPLLWFFIGRELGSRSTLTGLTYAVIVVASAIGVYGLFQTELGGPSEMGTLPSWDIQWFEITGYKGVVAEGGRFRPWGTFSSTSEYSGYLGIALVLAIAFLFHRRWVVIPAIPLLAMAMFSAGGRSVLALSGLTVVILIALLSRNGLLATIIVLLGIGAIYVAALTFGPQLDRTANLSGGAAKRQVSGLLNPLDPNRSTFLTHWENLRDGVIEGVTNPAGQGSAATNTAATRLSDSKTLETDIDIADVFVSLGLLGGVLFLAIVVMAFHKTFGRYLRAPRRDPLVFAVAAVLVVSFGQWLNGGHYAAAPLTWFFMGWAVRPRGGGSSGAKKEARQNGGRKRRPWERRRRRRSSSSGAGRSRRSSSGRPTHAPRRPAELELPDRLPE